MARPAARPDTWMPMYWGDYTRDTGHLSAASHGAYLMLIKHYWCTGQALPDDDKQLWRIACADSPAAWKKLRLVVSGFFVIEDGVWHHKRIDAELERAMAITEAKAEAGRTGAQKRWQKNSTPNDTRIAEPSVSQCQTNTPSQPPSPPQEESKQAARAISVEDASKPLAKARNPDDASAIALGTKALDLLGKLGDPTWTFGEVYVWRQAAREAGLDDAKLAAIVETEIKRVTAGKPTKARSLKYFTPAITEAILLRIPPQLERVPAVELPPVEVPEEYREACQQLAKLIGPRAHTVAFSQGLDGWPERIAFIKREIEFEQRAKSAA